MNLWTGAPLLALWLGSRLEVHRPVGLSGAKVSGAAVFVVIASLFAMSLALIKCLTLLQARWDRLEGRTPEPVGRRRASWLQPVSGHRRHQGSDGSPTRALDTVMVACVVSAVIAFEVWLILLAPPPI